MEPALILVKGANDMRVAQEKVRLFHERFGYAAPDQPELIAYDAAQFRCELIREELDEYAKAVEAGDLTGIASELADLAYVVLGTAVAHGIELAPLFDEVHRSNMTKAPNVHNPNDPVKGAAFERPRIAELLLVQTTDLGYAHGV